MTYECVREVFTTPFSERFTIIKGVFVSRLSNLFLGITFLEYEDENFITRYLEKICLVNFIIFLGTIKIGIIIGNYL